MFNPSPKTLVRDSIAAIEPDDRPIRAMYYRLAKILDSFMGREATIADVAAVNRDEFASFLAIDYSPATIANFLHAFDALARKLGVKPRTRRQGRASRPLSDAPGTLWHVLVHDYFPVNHAIRAVRTRANYRAAIVYFQQSLGHEPRVEDLTDDNIGALMNRLLDRGLAVPTVNGIRSKLRCLWEWLARRRRVEHFPTVGKLRAPKRVPKAWTLEQLGKLLAVCRRQRGYIVPGIAASDFWCALHGLLWDSAERIAAVLSLEWPMLDLETGELTVPYTIRKGQSADASYRLRPETLEILRRIKAAGYRRIFEHRFHIVTLYDRYAKLLRAADLPNDRWSKFHRMRRTVASHLAARGFDACAALGHSSPAVTKVYLDPTIVGTVRPADVLPALG